MEIRIRKIKTAKNDKISINYDYYNNKANTWDEYSFSCSDEPRPELRYTLGALAEHVIIMCELPDEYLSRIIVTGVSFSFGGEKEVMGAVIISQMLLENSNCNLNLNTPHKTSEPYSDSEVDPKQLLSEKCIEDLYELIEEVKLYIKGERAQLSLFAVK